jgi:hypothetical protein
MRSISIRESYRELPAGVRQQTSFCELAFEQPAEFIPVVMIVGGAGADRYIRGLQPLVGL